MNWGGGKRKKKKGKSENRNKYQVSNFSHIGLK